MDESRKKKSGGKWKNMGDKKKRNEMMIKKEKKGITMMDDRGEK